MNFFTFNEDADTARLVLRGPVCSQKPIDFWQQGKESITPKELDEALNSCEGKRKVVVEINSQGGEVFSGISISNRLKNLKAETEAVVMGVAASSASIILCGCKTRKACRGSQILIHEAHTVLQEDTEMDSEGARKLAENLEAINSSIAEIYAGATKLDVKECRKLMAKETWISAERALELGFVSEIVDKPADLVGEMRADIPLPSLTEPEPIMANTETTQTETLPAVPQQTAATGEAASVDVASLQGELDAANAKNQALQKELDEMKAAHEKDAKAQAALAVNTAVQQGKIAPQDNKTIEAMTNAYLRDPDGTRQILDSMAVRPGFGTAITPSAAPSNAEEELSPYEAVIAANQKEIETRK